MLPTTFYKNLKNLLPVIILKAIYRRPIGPHFAVCKASTWGFELLGFPFRHDALFPIYREGLLEDR